MKEETILRSLVGRVTDRWSSRVTPETSKELTARKVAIESLEPRILFSGAPAPAAEPAPADAVPVAQEPPAAAPVDDSVAAASAQDIVAPVPSAAVPPEPTAESDGAVEILPADPGGTAVVLTDAEVSAVAEAAAERWAKSGLTAEQSEALASATYVIADLDGSYLGSAEGNNITIDIDAAGLGWFVDPTPFSDEEFSGDGVFLTAEDGDGANRIDLLTTILHEQGHVLGLSESATGSGDLMFGFLEAGERKLPEPGVAEGVTPLTHEGVDYLVAATDNAGAASEDDPAISGNVIFDDDGSGVDTVPAQVIAVDGDPADVGVQVTLGSGALVTVDADGGYTYDPNGQFESLAAGETDTDTFEYTLGADRESSTFESQFDGDEIFDGASFVNGWANVGNTGAITETLNGTVLNLDHSGQTAGSWLEGTNSTNGSSTWNTANNADWTFEISIRFNEVSNGFAFWTGVDTDIAIFQAFDDRTQDSGAGTFNVAHNNEDGQFHTYRVKHDSVANLYHVWRDGVLLTGSGVAYDSGGNDNRLILGDTTSGTFGDGFNVDIAYIRYDQSVPVSAKASDDFASKFNGNDIWDGGFQNGWGELNGGGTTESLNGTVLKYDHTGSSAGTTLDGTASTNGGSTWNTANDGNWTMETRMRFNEVSNGFAFWQGVDSDRAIFEVYDNRTQDNGNNSFNVAHNNEDGQFHTYRVAHDSVRNQYHVWRDGVLLTDDGVGYDNSTNDGRLLFGDYTGGGFGNGYDVDIDYIRYDQTGAYAPPEIDTASVTVTIEGQNDAPVASDDTDTVSEDGSAVSIDVTANDSDVDTTDVLTPDAIVLVEYDAGTSGIAPDPTSVAGGEWTLTETEDGDIATGDITAGAISPDGATGLNAWNVSDNTNAGGDWVNYTKTLNAGQAAEAEANGWTLSSRLRMVDDFGDSAATLVQYGNGSNRFLVWFDLDGNGDLTAWTFGTGGSTTTLTSGGVGATDFHDFDIVYNPDTGTASLLFDGVQVGGTAWTGQANALQGVRFGTGSSGGQGSLNVNSIGLKVNGGVTLDSGATVNINGSNIAYNPNGQFEYLAAGETATDTFVYQITDHAGSKYGKASSEFDFKYEMDVAPNNQNLDGSGGDDWFDTGVPPVSGGFANGNGQLFRGDFSGSIWRGLGDGDYTIEFSAQALTTGSEGSLGTLGFFGEKPVDANAGLRFNIARNGQSTSNGGTPDVGLGADDNTDGQHVFRIAHEGSGNYWIWRDGVLLNPGDLPITGTNNSNNDGTFVGDFSSSLGGDWQIDYIRLTKGAFAPAALTDTATVTVTITGGNDAPSAKDDEASTTEDVVLDVSPGNDTLDVPAGGTSVLDNDTDPDTNDTLTVVDFDATSTNGATVSVNPDGTFTYDPTVSATIQALPENSTLTDTFTYTIKDSGSGILDGSGDINDSFGNLFGHYDAADYNGAVWTDSSSGAGSNLTNGSNKPTALANGGPNDLPYADFDGGDRIFGSEADITGGEYTIFLVGKLDTAGGYFYDGTTGSQRSTLHTLNGGTTAYYNFTSGGGTLSSFTADLTDDLGEWVLHTVQVNGEDSYHSVNGVIDSSGDLSGTGTFQSIILGARVNQANRLDGGIAEVLLYDRALTDGEISAVQESLGTKFDLTIESPGPSEKKGSEDFDFNYEMDTAPNNQDLDANSTDDWWDAGAPPVSGGIAEGTSGQFFRTDFGNSIWRANFPNDGAYTIEVRAKILNTGSEGASGTIAASFVRDNDDSAAILYLSRDGQAFNTGLGNSTDLGSTDNTDGFHDYRIVRDDAGEVWVYRDGDLLNPGGEPLAENQVGGATGLFIGDTGGATSGDYEIDYIRITTGAFAPLDQTATVTVTLDGLNDAPVLDTGVSMNMNDVSVADMTNDGDLVSDFYNGGISDVDDGSVEGVAITDADVPSGTGYYEYSTDGGTNWLPVGAVSDSSALLLLPTDRVRFVPDGVTQGGGTLSYRAWDQTGGTDTLVHTKVDASTTGGTTPFSTATATATAGVYNVVIDNGEIIYTAGDGEVNDIRVSIDPVTGELYIVDANNNPVTTGEADSDPSGNGIGIAYSGENLTIETNVEADIIRFGEMGTFTGSITAAGGSEFDQIESFRTDVTLGATSSIDMDAEEIKLMLSSFTAGGNIDLNGTTNGDTGAGPGGMTYDGLWLYGTDLETTVAGSTITLQGEGGDTGTYNNGIKLTNASDVTTADGDIDIDGTGGGDALFGTGVALHHGSSVSAGGTGNLTIDGTAGAGTSFNEGVFLSTYTSATVADGDLTIAGTASGTGSQNQGVDISVATLTATGTGKITVTGSGSGTGYHNTGVTTNATDITTTTGTVTLAGSGGARLQQPGRPPRRHRCHHHRWQHRCRRHRHRLDRLQHRRPARRLHPRGDHRHGLHRHRWHRRQRHRLQRGRPALRQQRGENRHRDHRHPGHRGGAFTGNRGVTLSGSTAESTGGGDISILGTASATSSAVLNDGVSLSYSHATTTGTLTMAGTGGGGSVLNTGVKVVGGSLSGVLDIDGTGGGSTHSNAGVYIMNSDLDGSLGGSAIDGTGGTGSGLNLGAFLQGTKWGALTTDDVTTYPDNDEDEKGGNFFSILPLALMATTDRLKRKGGMLERLVARLQQESMHRILGDDEVLVCRCPDGHILLEPESASGKMIENSVSRFDLDIPELLNLGKRILIVLGEDHDLLSGVIVNIGEDGNVLGHSPMIVKRGSKTCRVGDFIEAITAVSGGTAWSNETRRSHKSATISDFQNANWTAFGIESEL